MSKVLLMIKGFGSFKNNILLKAAAGVLAAALLTVCLITFSYSDEVNKGLADNLIRLHVIANSDSEEDQALKRDVRDAILAYMRDELKDSQSLDQTRYIINRDMDKIVQIARTEIKSHGRDFEIRADLGNYTFPTKAYGDITLPSGYYEALKVVIGKGEGANWWCVLFPPLCFVDATHGTVPDSVKDKLKESLTPEEYALITSSDSDGEIPVKIKFKVVELLQESKIKFTGMISKIFGSDE